MAEVHVKGGTVSAGRIEKLLVGFDGLPDRTIDRATALRWMADGHSFLPVVGGRPGPALQLVEVGDGFAIRTDNAQTDADELPALPTI